MAEYYEALSAEPRSGVARHELIAFENAHGIALPHPVREFYLRLDGLNGDVPEFGLHALQLWPLLELSRVSDRVAQFRGIPDYGPIVDSLARAEEYIAFGDGAAWSHVLAFRVSPDAGPVLWICGASYATMAPSFEEFWER